MIPGFLRAGAQALRYWEQRQEVVSHNLANAETTGFKAERVFAHLLGDSLSTGARTDLRAGAMTSTGNVLDLAIEGDGFFVVQTPAGERLTRGGSLQISTDGLLVTAQGHPLLGDNGPINVKDGQVTVDEQGRVALGGIVADRLRVVVPAETTTLAHEGGVLFRAEGALETQKDMRVRQGVLEGSNVETLQSMVEMIEVQRAYSAVQGSLRTLDGIMDTVANQLGRVT